VLAVAGLLGALTAAFGLLVWQRIDRVTIDFPGSPDGGTTFLLIGSDSREFVSSSLDQAHFGSGEDVPGERADVLLLVRVFDAGDVAVLPLPRDLMVQLPQGAPVRLATTLQRGPQTVVDTVCRSLGVGVDHLVLLHFDGLRRVVDATGGVTVDVPAPQRDLVTGLTLDAGVNDLDGDEALAYVRSRHLEQFADGRWRTETPTADARARRARDVLTQVGANLDLTPTAPWASASKLWSLAGAVTVDDDASPFVLRDFSRELGGLAQARELQLPVSFHPGAVPIADLLPSGRTTIESFQRAAHPECTLRPLIRSTPTAPSRQAATGQGDPS
jgi:LCP family protein required for cell wall assembly